MNEKVWCFLVSYLLENVKGVTEAEIVDSAFLEKDLGMDSLELVELVMASEKEFDIEILDEDAIKFKTVGNIRQYLENRLN